ncbi:UNVERIFIED_CONTAM: hypothetical protein Slati_3930000 [Sesamum latifolium]|uniref:Uncharacterized protein n=1 Tax=Sesamum latifolium TaxID=2727402 RepID=A0AAW2TMZ9_9LAMI
MEKGTTLAVYTPLVGGRNVSPWSRLTNSSYLDKWSQEVLLSKNVKSCTLRATHHELPRQQQLNNLAPLRALWIVPSLKVMQSGMTIFDLPENFTTSKDIGSGLKMCLVGAEINYASSKYTMLFTLRC